MSRLTRALLVAAAATLPVGGCAADGARAKTPPPAVTKAEAARILQTFAARFDRAAATHDTGVLGGTVTGSLLPIELGRSRIGGSGDHGHPDHPAGGHGHPAFFIPRRSGTRAWFAAEATPAGSALPRLLVFTGDGHGWRAAYAVPLGAGPAADTVAGTAQVAASGTVGATAPGAALPRPLLDRQGYATAGPPGAGDLAVSPDGLADVHAGVNRQGDAGFGAAVIDPGLWTTEYATAMQEDTAVAARAGSQFMRHYHANGYPAYALRTRDGGALVWYAVSDEIAVIRDKHAPAGSSLKISPDLAGIVGRDMIENAFQAASVHEYVAYDPPRGHGRVRVLGAYGGPVGGVGR